MTGNPVTVPVGCGCGVSLYSSAVLLAGAACVLVCARLALRMACGGVCVLRDLFLVGCFTVRVAVCPLGCLFVGCVLLCCVLLVCCGLFCLSAIACCEFRERSRAGCDVVHAGLCGCAFDGNRDCRLFFTV